MHTHQSLFKDGKNAFFDPKNDIQLSQTCLHYVGGLLQHAKGFCAITNPLVNSYKRLVPGYEAPTAIAWSEKNRSPRGVLPGREVTDALELRFPILRATQFWPVLCCAPYSMYRSKLYRSLRLAIIFTR